MTELVAIYITDETDHHGNLVFIGTRCIGIFEDKIADEVIDKIYKNPYFSPSVNFNTIEIKRYTLNKDYSGLSSYGNNRND